MGEEKIKWIGALEAELDSLTDRNVKEDITSQDLYERYWSQGKQVKMMPSKVVAVKKTTHDGQVGGWLPKGRVCLWTL